MSHDTLARPGRTSVGMATTRSTRSGRRFDGGFRTASRHSLFGRLSGRSPAIGQASEPASASAGVTDVSAVLRSAVQWAAALDLDPIRIRDELGMKGIKHWTEFLCLLTYAAGHFDSETANEAREVAARFAPRVLQPTYSNFTLLPTTHKVVQSPRLDAYASKLGVSHKRSPITRGVSRRQHVVGSGVPPPSRDGGVP